jgi:WhiB family transcriptional regulator, redox-sensing transcriptional regulator
MANSSRLPAPVADVWEWQLRGSCRDADPGLFFHPDGERGTERHNRLVAAKAICAGCPVVRQCGEHALSVREPYGVWGGMSEDDREAFYYPPHRSRSRFSSDASWYGRDLQIPGRGGGG